jgi:hypothetical protein
MTGTRGEKEEISPRRLKRRYILERETIMRVIQATNREEGGHTIVSLIFKAREQLLDPADPSPPERQELTEEAEVVITGNCDAVPLKKPVDLEIRLHGDQVSGSDASIPDAVRHHFRYVLSEHEKEWVVFLRARRVSLSFTVMNILIAFIYIVTLYENEAFMTSFVGLVTGAVIVILNWATIWGTYEYFIYDGLERKHRLKLLRKIIGAEIRVIPV